jgi:hypothetical protein
MHYRGDLDSWTHTQLQHTIEPVSAPQSLHQSPLYAVLNCSDQSKDMYNVMLSDGEPGTLWLS